MHISLELIGELRFFLLNLHSYKFLEGISEAKLKEMFDKKKEHIRVLIRYCIDTLHEVAYYDHR